MRQRWTFEKSKDRQVIAKLKLLLDLTQIISSQNLLGNNKKFNCNTNSHNTNNNLFLKYLATKTIEGKKLPFQSITQNTGEYLILQTEGELILKYTGEYNTYFTQFQGVPVNCGCSYKLYKNLETS